MSPRSAMDYKSQFLRILRTDGEVGMTKQEILDYFKDINAMYNNPNMLDSLSNMIDELLKAKDINVPTKWVSVKDRMPTEHISIFWPLYGRKEWNNAMWREQSDKVLMTVAFEDGTRLVTTGETHDGEWNTSISKTLNPIVTHWTPLPEPPKEGDGE